MDTCRPPFHELHTTGAYGACARRLARAQRRRDEHALLAERSARRAAELSARHDAERWARHEELARRAATEEQNREAAAAVFVKAQEAVHSNELRLALRRLERCVALHPVERASPRRTHSHEALQRTARTYVEWRQAVEELLAEQEAEEAAEGVGRADGAGEGWRADEPMERCRQQWEVEREWERRRRTAREEGVRAREDAIMREAAIHAARLEAERAKQAARLEVERKRQQVKREAEERRQLARREEEEVRARAAAQRRANIEAAETFAAKAASAAAAARHADSVRLLRKAAALRPWRLSYRGQLCVARLRLGAHEKRAALQRFAAARGGIRSYAALVLLLLVLCGLALVLLRKIACKLEAACARPRVFSSLGVCSRRQLLWSALHRAEEHAPAILAAIACAPAVLALLLPLRAYVALVSVFSALSELARDLYRALVAAGGEAVRSAAQLLRALWSELLEEQEEEARRSRHQQREPPHQRQSQQRQSSSGYDWRQQGSERDPPRPARRAPTSEETLEQRARALPAGDVRRVLLSKSHYQVLGVASDCTRGEAKKAFHRLALRLHPDKCSQTMAEDAFKKLEQVWHALQLAIAMVHADSTSV
ncbi:hypothetical protein AB1Y20_017278 [Prymnesium parvum]|uniref:J domain-containing protein n=1 Tax=Prymnesium parvum TaxID=97485 RepID=A0AB34JJQ7_PRYPA